MPGMRVRASYQDLGLSDVARQLDWLGAAWAEDVAALQVEHHQAEAPIGQEIYRDLDGNWHPGWLRESVVATPLPGGGQWVQVEAVYGIFVNNGTRYMAANPFWDRATMRTELQTEDILDRLMPEFWARTASR
jgi:hypothetical protein